jgi:zinc transport system substrate-binding protein
MFNRIARAGALLLGMLCAAPLRADAPRVAADIPPVHALVAQVMAGVGAPELIVAPGTSPHGYALRPSEAQILQDADLVVWMGPGLTPWLGAALPRIATRAEIVTLETDPATRRLPLRDRADFAAVGDAGHGGGDQHGHDHGDDPLEGLPVDPHMWLDPANGRAWLGVIAAALSRIDPDNAARYAANAAAAQTDLAALESELAGQLAAAAPPPFVVFHDGFQYFEDAFGVPAAGAIVLADGSDPSPARIAEIRAVVRERGVRCAFVEPQLNAALVETVIDGTDAEIAQVDPLGATHTPGPALYGAILRDMVQALSTCAAAR